MKKFSIITYILAFTFCLSAAAQKAKKTNTSTTSAPTPTAEQLIQKYRFSEAVRLLQREIETAKKEERSTIRLEQDLKRATMGFDMLRGTEKIIFIDSVKVSRAQVLNNLRLSSEAGRIVSTQSESQKFDFPINGLGKNAYINELGDRIIFSVTDSTHSTKKLHVAFRSGNKWTSPTLLEGLDLNPDEDQDYPFMMPDGVTLYYAAQGDESLGGYDLFVTRYNTDSKHFLKAENLGMPFNSPANDYMLAIDEQNNLGWLVTDRYQQADSVCIYTFIPNSTRDVYDTSNCSNKQILHAAQLHSIAETQTDAEEVNQALQRLAQSQRNHSNTTESTTPRRYIINDQTVYTHTSQFRSDAARRIAEQADQMADQIAALQLKQDDLESTRASHPEQASQINQQLEQIKQTLPQLQKQYKTLCKNMRKAELQ